MTSLAITNIEKTMRAATAANDVAAGDEEGGFCVICYAAPVTVQLVHANETNFMSDCVWVTLTKVHSQRGDATQMM